jgi:type VI secretion system Hcp family effector
MMKDLLRIALRSLPCLMLTVSLAYGAQNYYLKIESASQGTVHGGISRKGNLWIPVLEVSRPAVGESLAKSQHKPIVVIKEIDATSAQLHQAMTKNEVLKEVVIDFVRSDAAEKGARKETVYQTITLTNATIASLKTIRSGKQEKEEEEILFTYQKIEVTDQAGKNKATDDWEAGRRVRPEGF